MKKNRSNEGIQGKGDFNIGGAQRLAQILNKISGGGGGRGRPGTGLLKALECIFPLEQ